MGDNKGRIIFLEHYLMDQSDESHPITTDELISILSEHGYSANRNTIHSDMAALQEAGNANSSAHAILKAEKLFNIR